MKKIYVIALVFVLSVSLVACGRKDKNTVTTPSTSATTIPDMLPPLETNIPDPSVDTSMPMYTDGTDGTDATDITDDTLPITGMDGRTRKIR